MRLWGHSLNIITLAGLALGAGMLVDNAIVVVESIHRRHRPGASAADTAARGTGDVAGAIVASTLTTCIVFLPVLFVQGLAARLIEGIAFTVTASLGASLAVAIMLIPALSRWLLPRAKAETAAPEPTTEASAAASIGTTADTDEDDARPLGWAFGAVERLVLALLRPRAGWSSRRLCSPPPAPSTFCSDWAASCCRLPTRGSSRCAWSARPASASRPPPAPSRRWRRRSGRLPASTCRRSRPRSAACPRTIGW